MAAAVQNSAVVVCFLTQQYQDSKNCKDEFKYARKKDKPIIPCLINPGWKPDGWLDMGVADLLYINFKTTVNASDESKCKELLSKIKQTVKIEDIQLGMWVAFLHFFLTIATRKTSDRHSLIMML